MLTALALAAALSGADSRTPAPIAGQAAAVAPTPAPDCGGMGDAMSGGLPMQCVTVPFEQIRDVALAYAAEARRHGWAVIRGDGNVLWMQKAETPVTCGRMTIVTFWNSVEHPQPVAGVPAFIGVITQTGQICEVLSPPTGQ